MLEWIITLPRISFFFSPKKEYFISSSKKKTSLEIKELRNQKTKTNSQGTSLASLPLTKTREDMKGITNKIRSLDMRRSFPCSYVVDGREYILGFESPFHDKWFLLYKTNCFQSDREFPMIVID